MNTHITHSSSYPYFCSSERRLCMRDLRDAHETLGALRDIEGNKAMQSAINLFTNPEALLRYPELQHALDRTIFLSLFFGSALPAGQKYAEVTHDTLNLTNPFELVKNDLEGTGKWLRQTFTARPDVMQKLGDDPNDPEALGQNYFDRIDRTKAAWEEKDVSRIDPLILDVAIERYRYAKRIILDAGIPVPVSGSDFLAQRGNALSRREYLALMTILWRGSVTKEDIQRAARGGITGIRSLIGDPAYQGDTANADAIYAALSPRELGPSEVLGRFDIDLSDLRRKFLLLREHGEISPDMIGRATDITGDGPKLTFEFLIQNLPATQRNKAFLKALGFYIDQNWTADIDPDPTLNRRALTDDEKERVSHMSQSDVLAVLENIRAHLVESEQTRRDFTRQQRELREARTSGEKIEEKVGDVWEYMKNFRDHPLGSGLMWATAAFLVVGMWRFLRKSHSRFTNLLFLGAIGGAAIGLYQQHKGDPAWWESLWGKIQDWRKVEKIKTPEDQTMVNYWTTVVDTEEMRSAREKEVDVSTEQTQEIFAGLGDQSIACVLDWYLGVNAWKFRGQSGNVPPPTAKLNVGMLRRYPALSKLGQKDMTLAVYEVLRRFFVDRGRKVQSMRMDFRAPALTGASTEETIGFAYITDKYRSTASYTDMMRGMVQMAPELDQQTLAAWQPGQEVPVALHDSNPDLYDHLTALTILRARRGDQIGSCDKTLMWHVLFLEEEFEILRRQKGGPKPAGFLRQMTNMASSAADSINPFRSTDVYPERASRMTLFSETERSLFASDGLGDSKFLWTDRLSDPEKEAVKERTVADWEAFLKRMPITEKAREKLQWYLMEFMTHWSGSLADLLNEVERKKYHLLIAVQKSETRLSKALETATLDPENDVTWREFFDTWISDWGFDDWHHPEITKLDDLYGLFNSEVPQHGGVKWWKYWYRMFPRWEQSKMYEFDPIIKQYKARFDQLRAMPQAFLLLNPALGTMPSKEAIDAMETHVARRFAGRLFEAMRVTHGRGTTVDRMEDRNVSPIEQQNLKEYLDAIFTATVGWRPELIEKVKSIEKKVQEIRAEKYASNAGLHVQIDPTKDSIKVGLLVGTRYVSNLPYIGSLLPTEFLYPIELTTKDFVGKPANHIIHDWKVHAMQAKSNAIGEDLQAEYHSDNSIVFWYTQPNTGSMPIHEFLQATKEQILEKLQ